MSVRVNVLQLPDLKLLAQPEACIGQQIIFYAQADSASSYTWQPGDIHSAVFTSVINGKSGEFAAYKASIEGINGCMNSDSILIRIAENCEIKKAGDVEVHIYPNPSEGNFSVMLSCIATQMVDISISSMDNKLIFLTENISVSGVRVIPIHLPDAAQGTYSILVRGNSGSLKDKIIIR